MNNVESLVDGFTRCSFDNRQTFEPAKKVDIEWLNKLIVKSRAEKAARRRAFSIRLMENYVGLYDCGDCFHGQTESCTKNLPNGCESFFDVTTGRRFPPEVVKKAKQKMRRKRRSKI